MSLIPHEFTDRVEIVKRVTNVDKKVKHLLDLDVFFHMVSPDCNVGMGESFCLAVTEAMMLGIPVVVENKGGVRQQVKHGYNGFLCNNVDGFVEHLMMLYRNKDLWLTMSNNAYHLPENIFLHREWLRGMKNFTAIY